MFFIFLSRKERICVIDFYEVAIYLICINHVEGNTLARSIAFICVFDRIKTAIYGTWKDGNQPFFSLLLLFLFLPSTYEYLLLVIPKKESTCCMVAATSSRCTLFAERRERCEMRKHILLLSKTRSIRYDTIGYDTIRYTHTHTLLHTIYVLIYM